MFNLKRRNMKKIVFLSMMMAIVMSMLVGCSSCDSKNPKQETVVGSDYDGVIPEFSAGVNHIVSMHRQAMFKLYDGQQYEWRNLKVIFNDSIKPETIDDLKIVDVTDVFFLWNDEGPHVQYISSNLEKGTIIPAPIVDVWIEDDDLDSVEIKLWPEDVLKRLKEWNGIIPSAKCMILRRPIGPRDCNAQWVLGDIGDPVFVDAVTGYITTWCPAFPIPNTNGPLGEWP